ncbi:hypothetical protein ACIBFB_26015 [Nocardiopsis sp. NPDC050513]|uniref:hypothetical protein n=1 Tax=Nocardiopsis sp. NPDC050513 TaxID=3364338 RepID=UPI0037B70D18
MPNPLNDRESAAGLARLQSLAEDVLANLAELERDLPGFVDGLGERLAAERTGPARMYALRANALLPSALYAEGLARLSRNDHAGAEILLTAAARRQDEATSRLRAWSEAVPSLRNEAEASERRGWTMRWETSKALRGLGRWHEAHEVLSAVLEHVRLDGRFGEVGRDLELVEARIRQADLAAGGRGVRAALQGMRPSSRKAGRPGLTPEGYVTATGEAPRSRSPLLSTRPRPERELRPRRAR